MTPESQKYSTVGLRILLAVVLFSAFVFLDSSGMEFLSISADKIYTCIQENYIANSFAFIREITYTFTHG